MSRVDCCPCNKPLGSSAGAASDDSRPISSPEPPSDVPPLAASGNGRLHHRHSVRTECTETSDASTHRRRNAEKDSLAAGLPPHPAVFRLLLPLQAGSGRPAPIFNTVMPADTHRYQADGNRDSRSSGHTTPHRSGRTCVEKRQACHQPRRQWRAAGTIRIDRTALHLEKPPIDRARKLHQSM